MRPSTNEERYFAGPESLTRDPKPGDIFGCDTRYSSFSVELAAKGRRQWPWVPLVLAGARPDALREVRDRSGCAWACLASESLPSTDEAATLAQARKSPGLDQVLELLDAMRIRTLSVRHLRAALTSASRHRSTHSRHLRTVGAVTLHEWRDLVWLVHGAHAMGGRNRFLPRHARWTVDRTAEELGCDVRTLRGRLRRLTGSSVARFLREPVWEWVVAEFVRFRLDCPPAHFAHNEARLTPGKAS